ncbi:hypothetical protein J4526_01835 [Desulfurococcaceae archaeon MEX13E-LK6-19]|nr:hypothetical protein J4526_01835 [Desulfurococcaceae archaeon MEX13E-LK6-19]
MLACHLYTMPFLSIDDIYDKLKSISDKPYVYINQSVIINGKQESLYASFYNIRKISEVIFGCFGYQYIDKEYNVENKRYETKKRNASIEFAIFNYNDKTYLCIFSGALKIKTLIEELERKLFGSYQGRINIVYLSRNQLRDIVDKIPHQTYGTAFDGLRDINGWTKLHVFGSNVESPQEYEEFSSRALEPDKDYMYSDFRYKSSRGKTYKFRIIRKNPKSSSLGDTLTVICYNLFNEERDKLFLINYIKENILASLHK